MEVPALVSSPAGLTKYVVPANIRRHSSASSPIKPMPVSKKAEVGFEPTNNGFAIRPLSPLGYSAGVFDDSGEKARWQAGMWCARCAKLSEGQLGWDIKVINGIGHLEVDQ